MAIPVREDAVAPAASGIRARSTYREAAPPGALADAVWCVWTARAGWSRALRALPDGGVDVAFDGTHVVVTPPRAAPVVVEVRGGTTTTGARLRPGRAAAVLGVPIDELAGPTPLEELWPERAVAHLADGLAATADDDARAALLARLLAERPDPADRPERPDRPDRSDRSIGEGRLLAAVTLLGRADADVATVAAAVGWSERQLHRRCRAAVGLAPKALQAVFRFQRALAQIEHHSFAEIAATCGYADQPHLTREVRRLTGSTPAQLRRTRCGLG